MSDLEFMTCSAQELELQAAEREKRLAFWPRWMRTRWGQWFARNWAPTGHLWRAEVRLAQTRELDAAQYAAANKLARVVHDWAESDFSEPSPALRERLIGAWCVWRTQHERVCEHVGCSPEGSAEWIKRWTLPVSEERRH
jgi:hypothetical protein